MNPHDRQQRCYKCVRSNSTTVRKRAVSLTYALLRKVSVRRLNRAHEEMRAGTVVLHLACSDGRSGRRFGWLWWLVMFRAWWVMRAWIAVSGRCLLRLAREASRVDTVRCTWHEAIATCACVHECVQTEGANRAGQPGGPEFSEGARGRGMSPSNSQTGLRQISECFVVSPRLGP